jgi:hypothetical protein
VTLRVLVILFIRSLCLDVLLIREACSIHGLLGGGIVRLADVFLQVLRFGRCRWPNTAICNVSANCRAQDTEKFTMVFAIASHAEAPRFDRREAQSDGLAECRGVYVGNAVLVADPTIGEVEALAGHITIGVRCVISREPERWISTKLLY